METVLPWSCKKGRRSSRRRSIVKRKRESGPRIKHPPHTRLRESGPRVILPPPRPTTGSPSGPRVTLPTCHSGRCGWKENRECAKIALAFYNQKNLSEQEPKYELVKARPCIMFQRGGYYHCNFIARQKNEFEAKQFFAELRLGGDSEVDDGKSALPLVCRLCFILGPSETGLFGCTSCDRHPGLMTCYAFECRGSAGAIMC